MKKPAQVNNSRVDDSRASSTLDPPVLSVCAGLAMLHGLSNVVVSKGGSRGNQGRRCWKESLADTTLTRCASFAEAGGRSFSPLNSAMGEASFFLSLPTRVAAESYSLPSTLQRDMSSFFSGPGLGRMAAL